MQEGGPTRQDRGPTCTHVSRGVFTRQHALPRAIMRVQLALAVPRSRPVSAESVATSISVLRFFDNYRLVPRVTVNYSLVPRIFVNYKLVPRVAKNYILVLKVLNIYNLVPELTNFVNLVPIFFDFNSLAFFEVSQHFGFIHEVGF